MPDPNAYDYFNNTINRDLFHLICGDKLGAGIARAVYACNIRPDLVVKIETPSESFQNVLEWEFWQAWSEVKDVRRWLAPCESISPCGTILLQYRTTPVEKFPDRMPSFLSDTKRSNYGRFRGRIVCHDYGMVVANASTTLRKIGWRDE